MIRFLAVLIVFAVAPDAARAQDYPTKPVRILVGFAPSGGTDITVRIIAKTFAEQIGQQAVVENRPGGGGLLAAELVARAAPDGYTILLGAVGPFAVTPHMQTVTYDVERDFAPITLAVTFSNVLVVHPSVAARTLADYLKLATGPEHKLAYGTSGVGSAGHLAGELLKEMAKVDITHVAYRGGGPAMADLIGGHIPSLFASLPSALPQIQQGRIRAIAMTGPVRVRDLADVPTIAESGYAGYEATNWYAFVAPGKTPPGVVEKLNRELGRALRSRAVILELEKHGLEAKPGTPGELARFMRSEFATWGRVVKAAGIRAA